MSIHVVTGPPCSGKSTHVEEHRDQATSVVLDLDVLAHTLGHPDSHQRRGDKHLAYILATEMHGAILRYVLDSPEGRALVATAQVWIVDTDPPAWRLSKYRRAGAEITAMRTPLDECHRRATAAGRDPRTHDEIDALCAHAPLTSDGRAFFESAATTQTDSAGSPPRESGKTGEPR